MKYHMIPIYVIVVQLLLSPYLFSSFKLFFNQRQVCYDLKLNSSPEGSSSGEVSDALRLSKESSTVVDRALDSALDFLQDAEVEAEVDDEFDLFEIYEDSPDLEIPYDLIAELEERDSIAAANKGPSATVFNKANIDAAVARWRKHDKDVGSAEVQVAIANEKIKYLTKHLLANKKDVAAKRGLDNLVTTRRKFLNYLFLHDSAKALEMVKELKIRFRPPGRMWDKDAKYGAFKNTKTVFKTKRERV